MISESIISGDMDRPYSANVYRSEPMIIQWKSVCPFSEVVW